MGKKEMEPMPIKYLIAIVFLIMLGIVMYLFAFSVPLNHLEAKAIHNSDFKVAQVNQFTFPMGGQAVVATDAGNHGLVLFYAKIPVINRYMRTKVLEYTEEEDGNNFAAAEWSTMSAFTVQDGVATRLGGGEDMGYGGKVLLFLLWLEGFIIATTLIRNDVIKTRKEKAANPVKNY